MTLPIALVAAIVLVALIIDARQARRTRRVVEQHAALLAAIADMQLEALSILGEPCGCALPDAADLPTATYLH